MAEDREYFATRSLQEKAAAERAQDATSQAIHFDLALRYQRLADYSENSGAFDQAPPSYVKMWGDWEP